MRFAADENFDGRILDGLKARLPDLDILRVQDRVSKLLGVVYGFAFRQPDHQHVVFSVIRHCWVHRVFSGAFPGGMPVQEQHVLGMQGQVGVGLALTVREFDGIKSNPQTLFDHPHLSP